jgi:DNA-binding transcriptional LysR family regulator
VADHGEALVEAAISGLGLFQAHDYVVADALVQGRLVEVLADFRSPGPPISLLLAPGRRTSPKVRAFVEFMVEVLGPVAPVDAERSRTMISRVGPAR